MDRISQRHSFQAPPDSRALPSRDACPVPLQDTPRQNQILAALPREDYERLLPHLSPIDLPQRWTIYDTNRPRDYLYFLTTGIASRCSATKDGALAGTTVTGREGVVGIASILGGSSMTSQSAMLCAGHAYRLPTHLLKREFARGGPLMHFLLNYTLTLITHMSLTAACIRHHSVKQQLCSLILSGLDRLPSNKLTMTQEDVAELLGVRRESISEAAGVLRTAGLIAYNRGRITALDRPRMEAQACECYGVVKQEYARLLSIFRKSQHSPEVTGRQAPESVVTQAAP